MGSLFGPKDQKTTRNSLRWIQRSHSDLDSTFSVKLVEPCGRVVLLQGREIIKLIQIQPVMRNQKVRSELPHFFPILGFSDSYQI